MTDQQKNLLKAKISLALLDENGRRPEEKEVERYTKAAVVLYKAILGLHFERRAMKLSGQLPIF